MDASTMRYRAMRVQFFPKHTHIGEIVKNGFVTLLEIVERSTKS
jgi:hypothetical protein